MKNNYKSLHIILKAILLLLIIYIFAECFTSVNFGKPIIILDQNESVVNRNSDIYICGGGYEKHVYIKGLICSVYEDTYSGIALNTSRSVLLFNSIEICDYILSTKTENVFTNVFSTITSNINNLINTIGLAKFIIIVVIIIILATFLIYQIKKFIHKKKKT